MFFSFLKKKSTLSFVFDIRDALVSLAVVRFLNDKKPEIIFCQNFKLDFQDTISYKRYTSSLIKKLDEAILYAKKKLIKMGNTDKVDSYNFFLGSPWSVSQTKTIKIIKDKPFEINNELLKRLILDEETIAKKTLEDETIRPDWKVLEEKIIQSKVNGYKVDDIFGKKTTHFVSELFTSFIPLELKEKLNSFYDKTLCRNVKKQNNSCIISSYSFLRDLYSDMNDFIYVDVGKLVTDVYLVRDDIIFGIVTFPVGEEKIIQTSLSKINLPREIFMSHLSIGQDNKFALQSHNNGEDLLRSGFDLWNENFKESVMKICNEMNIPNKIFIITNSLIPNILVKDLIKKQNNKQLEILGAKMEIINISENVINGFVANSKNFPHQPYVKMDLVFLDKIINKKL